MFILTGAGVAWERGVRGAWGGHLMALERGPKAAEGGRMAVEPVRRD